MKRPWIVAPLALLSACKLCVADFGEPCGPGEPCEPRHYCAAFEEAQVAGAGAGGEGPGPDEQPVEDSGAAIVGFCIPCVEDEGAVRRDFSDDDVIVDCETVPYADRASDEGVQDVGDFVVRMTAFQALREPDVRRVDGNLVIRENDLLVDIDLPALEEVDGDLLVEDNRALQAVGMPSLRRVGGRVRIEGNTALRELYAPGLVAVGADAGIVLEPGASEVACSPHLSTSSCGQGGCACADAGVLGPDPAVDFDAGPDQGGP